MGFPCYLDLQALGPDDALALVSGLWGWQHLCARLRVAAELFDAENSVSVLELPPLLLLLLLL